MLGQFDKAGLSIWGRAGARRRAQMNLGARSLNLKDSGMTLIVSSLCYAWLMSNKNSGLRYGEAISKNKTKPKTDKKTPT